MKVIKWIIASLICSIPVFLYGMCLSSYIPIKDNSFRAIVLIMGYGMFICFVSISYADKFEKWFDSKLK